MTIFILMHTASGRVSEICGVYGKEPLALAALVAVRDKLLGQDGGRWVSAELSEDGRTLAYGGKGGISFIPGFYKITEHEVLSG